MRPLRWCSSPFFGFVALALLGAATDPSVAQCELDDFGISDSGILAPPTFNNDALAVSADGGVIAIGAQEYSEPERSSGAVHVFARGSDGRWHPQQIVLNPQPAFGDLFGSSVELSADGRLLVVGHETDDDRGRDAGAVHVFRFDGAAWTRIAKLTASNGRSDDHFGKDVAVTRDGQRILVGAPDRDSGGATSTGVVHVFDRIQNGWSETARIEPLDLMAGDLFGDSLDVSADGHRVIVGGFTPTAQIFEAKNDAWTRIAALRSDDPAFAPRKVVLSDDGRTALVASPFESPGGDDLGGAVYVHVEGEAGWVVQAKFTDPRGNVEFPLGADIDLSADGNTAVLPFGIPSFDNPGDAAVMRREGETWSEIARIVPQSEDDILTFGLRAALAPDTSVVAVLSHRDFTFAHHLGVHTLDGFCGLRLALPTPGVAGVVNSISAFGAKPGDAIHFAYATAHGVAPVPGCPGLFAELAKPTVLGQAIADDSGEATLEVFVPQVAAGRAIYVQAVNRQHCALAPLIFHTFE